MWPKFKVFNSLESENCILFRTKEVLVSLYLILKSEKFSIVSQYHNPTPSVSHFSSRLELLLWDMHLRADYGMTFCLFGMAQSMAGHKHEGDVVPRISSHWVAQTWLVFWAMFEAWHWTKVASKHVYNATMQFSSDYYTTFHLILEWIM